MGDADVGQLLQCHKVLCHGIPEVDHTKSVFFFQLKAFANLGEYCRIGYVLLAACLFYAISPFFGFEFRSDGCIWVSVLGELGVKVALGGSGWLWMALDGRLREARSCLRSQSLPPLPHPLNQSPAQQSQKSILKNLEQSQDPTMVELSPRKQD